MLHRVGHEIEYRLLYQSGVCVHLQFLGAVEFDGARIGILEPQVRGQPLPAPT